LVLAAGTEEQKQSILPTVAAGEVRLAVAHLEPAGSWDASGIEMTATREGEELVLDGTKAFVIDGHTAHTLIVVARTDPTSSGSDGISLIVVPSDAPGVDRRRIETMDQTRKLAEITFAGTRVPMTAVVGSIGSGWDALERTLTRAVVALAFEQVGGAQRCLDMSVDYAKARVQFGRPIGSFQAVKHKCADMLVEIEAAKSAAYYAGWAVTVDDADLGVAASLAKSYCSEAYSHAAGESIQVHGGIGFTWEHDAHLYFKRSKTDELLFGTPSSHRKKLADILDL
jgi:alkylation response protein AidB-like acyl-CoA dehydrogenase